MTPPIIAGIVLAGVALTLLVCSIYEIVKETRQ
jgi:hypothetical protein